MSVLKFRDENGNVVTLPFFKGDKGEKGDVGSPVTILSVTQSTEDGGDNVVTFSGGTTLTVKNGTKGSTGTKGDKGDTGTFESLTEEEKTEIVNLVAAYILGGTWTFALSDGSTVTAVLSDVEPEEPVPNPDAGITPDATEITLEEGQSGTITATVIPEFEWDSTELIFTTESDCIELGEDGSFTAVSEGTAIVTISTADGLTATVTITVTAAGLLPSTYQQVEYIYNTASGGYLLTGVNGKSGLEIRGVFKDYNGGTLNSNAYVVGSTNSSNQRCYIAYNDVNSSYDFGAISYNIFSGSFGDKITFTAKWETSGCTFTASNSNGCSGSAISAFDNGSEMAIFGRNKSGTVSATGVFYLYSMEFYEDGVQTRNFVPCYRKSDSVVGLYDTVNGVFYTNSGTGSFLKGADV